MRACVLGRNLVIDRHIDPLYIYPIYFIHKGDSDPTRYTLPTFSRSVEHMYRRSQSAAQSGHCLQYS